MTLAALGNAPPEPVFPPSRIRRQEALELLGASTF
jgi:hypothetical protein